VATYILLSTLTDEGRKTVKARPERVSEVNKEVEAMGGKVTAQYAMFGKYDFMNVIEAADNMVIARLAVELGARGTVHITTLAAISPSALSEALRAPG
jgi:uncharacterized protein with GYD domain